MHTMSVYIACEQFIRHQTVEWMQARSEDFHTRVAIVRALLHTRVFMKFKLSCTVRNNWSVCDIMLNKNTWSVKKCGANQKQHCKQAGATKRFDIS